jgi:hypothetical protein
MLQTVRMGYTLDTTKSPIRLCLGVMVIWRLFLGCKEVLLWIASWFYQAPDKIPWITCGAPP